MNTVQQIGGDVLCVLVLQPGSLNHNTVMSFRFNLMAPEFGI
jgi:hypothetical protein